jgi:hypothetical protein
VACRVHLGYDFPVENTLQEFRVVFEQPPALTRYVDVNDRNHRRYRLFA